MFLDLPQKDVHNATCCERLMWLDGVIRTNYKTIAHLQSLFVLLACVLPFVFTFWFIYRRRTIPAFVRETLGGGGRGGDFFSLNPM